MGVNDINSNGFNADISRYNRLNRTQQPEFAPGQDAIYQQQDDFFSNTVATGTPNDLMSSLPSSNQAVDIFNSGINTGSPLDANGLQIGSNSLVTQQQPITPPKDESEIFFEMFKKSFLGLKSFVGNSVTAWRATTPLFWNKYSGKIALIGGVMFVLGLVMKVFGLSIGLRFAISGCFLASGGFVTLFFTTESARKCNSQYKDEHNTMQNFSEPSQSVSEEYNTDSMRDWENQDQNWDSTSSDWDGNESWGSSDDDDSYDDDLDAYGDWGSDDDYNEPVASEGMNTEDALASLTPIAKGMYTRQYLYEMFEKRLPTITPNFTTMREFDEGDDIFLLWEEYLQEAASVAGSKDDFLPTLVRLQENLFTIIVTCTRPQGFKPELTASELANIYAYKDGEKNEKVYAKVDNVGRECVITIFNGTSAMVSVKDMMNETKDFILNTKNYMPVILGVNQLGKVITTDFKKLESIIVAGMPRMGKSWFVQAVLTQMCAYVSPKELHIYICDPKEGISDYKGFCLPHVKKFVSTDDGVVDTLRNLVKIEAPRRKKIIGDAGNVNIWDFKERYPDVKLPIIYVAIDEVVTLAERMDKEVKKEFQGLLIELISQLPALGIRAILIPHVVKNDIIAKTASDLVPCRISVCGNAEHIEACTATKPKDFPFKLVNLGDMAMKLTGFPSTMYIHGPVLTDDNVKNNELFDYLRRAWATLEPDEVKDSVANGMDEKMENKKILEQLQDSSDEVEVFGNPNDSNSDTTGFEDFDEYF